MSYRVKPLADGDDLDSFDCGHDALNVWLREHAQRAIGQGTRTYLLIEDDTQAVVHDFQPSPADARRLIMKLSTAARALDLDWP